MQPWSVEFSFKARRDLDSLDPNVARRVLAKLESVSTDPPRRLKRLKGEERWALRIGDYRALAVLSFATRTVVIHRIDHRSRVYDR